MRYHLQMGRAMVISIAVAMGLIISPESLIVLGSGVGGGGVYFILAISIASICYVPNIITQSIAAGAGGETKFLKATIKPLLAGTSLIASRVGFTLCALPVVMSTAGFVFNETFLYRFPNFLFAHLLLITLALIIVINRRISEVLQVVFITLAISGLLVLSIIGFVRPPEVLLVLSPGGFPSSVSVMFTAIFLFVGFDLMYLSGRKAPEEATAAITAVMFAVIIFTLWALTSFFHVPLEKLSSTTVPYSRVARAVLGEPGRLVMGVVMISGAAAMANALLMGVGRMMTEMASEGMLPGGFLIGRKRDAAPVVFLAGMGVAFMLLGFAGGERLFLYMRAALLLWVLHYALLHTSVVIALRENRKGSILALSAFGLVFFTISFILLVIMHEDRGELVRSIFYLITGGFAVSAVNILTGRNRKY